nr:uncharacterized mitochondrial protein AtMg00810-like [Tanacetum cinerariifolium]
MARERKRKARTTLLMALPEDHLTKFHKISDAKEMWEAIKSSAGVSHKDANQKFLRSLPSSWSQVALIIKTKPGLDTLSFDDLYNNLRVFEHDVKGTTPSSLNTQNVAFVYADNTSSTNDINDDDMEEMDLKWHFARDCKAKGNQDSRRKDVGYNGNKARDHGRRSAYQDDSTALVTIDGEDINWSRHVEEGAQNYDIMAYSSSNLGSDNETSVDESNSKPNEYASCESDSSVETTTSMPTPVEIAPNVVYEPKVWNDAPIIEEENVKETSTPNHSPKIKKQDRNGRTRKGLGYDFTRKTCFVCGSFSHLIRNCDFHEKRMAKQVELTKSKNKVTGQRDNRPVWNNVQRVNHQNKFVSSVALTKTGKFPVNAARQNYFSQASSTSTASKVNTARLFGGSVGFGGSNGRITGKRKIKAGSKAFRLYNLETKRVEENLHVKFLENKPNVARKGHAWMFDLDFLTNSMNYEHVSVENQANKSTGPKEANNSAGTQANDDQRANSEKIDLYEEHFVLPIWYAYSTTVKSSGDKIEKNIDFKTCKKPVSQVEQIFLEELEKLKRQEKEANVATRKETTHENQDAHYNITSLLNAISTPLNAVGPSRAFNNGEPSYPDDLLMPYLEDIYASLSEGIFTDSSYKDEGVVKQKEDGIFISQDKYVAEILKKFDFLSVKTASTPIETQKPLVKDEEAAHVDVHLYRSMIGSLMHLTASRPNIMFPVCACSRFQVTPKTLHLQAVKRIFRYLKGQPKLGLWYLKVSSFDLEAYSDSDYAGVNLDRKSTIGGCQFLCTRLIRWQCKKQTIVATSTREAEYRVVVSEDVIRQDLRLDDADGVECLPNEEIFTELARMGYEKPPPNAKRTVWNELSCSMASAVICLATVIINAQVNDLSSHNNQYTSSALTQKVFANIRRVGKGFFGVETPLFATIYICYIVPKGCSVGRRQNFLSIGDFQAQEEGQEVREAEEIEVFWFKEVKKGRKDDVSATATKEASAAEPTVFDDEVTMSIAQRIIKMKAEKARLLNEQMAKRLHDEEAKQAAAREKQEKDDLEKAKGLQQQNDEKQENLDWNNIAGYKMEHFRGMTYDKVRFIFEREYNKVQTLFKPDKYAAEPIKRRVIEETLLQESFKNLKAVEVSVSKFKVEALQVKYPLIDWEIHYEGSRSYWKIIRVGGIKEAYHSFEDMLKGFDREDLDALWRLVKEKFRSAMPTVDKEKALWRSSDEDLHGGQQTKDQKFGYILQVIKKLELKKLDGLLGKIDGAAEVTEEITLSS